MSLSPLVCRIISHASVAEHALGGEDREPAVPGPFCQRVDSKAHIGLVGGQPNPVLEIVRWRRRCHITIDHDEAGDAGGSEFIELSSRRWPTDQANIHGRTVRERHFGIVSGG